MEKRKIDAMHKLFGMAPMECRECPHLTRVYARAKKYIKCRAYGLTSSEASDWKLSNIACGLIKEKLPENFVPVIERLKHAARPNIDIPVEGQMKMEV